MSHGREPTALEVFVGNLGVHQDFFWFVVLLAWSLALVVWWRTALSRSRWSWLPWAAGAGAASAFAAFLMFDPPLNVFYERLVPGTTSNFVPAAIDPNLFGDLLLAWSFAAMVGGWTWHALLGRARALRWLGAGVVAAVAVAQGPSPAVGGGLLAAMALVAAGLFARRTARRGGVFSAAALGASACLPLLSTIGPVAWAAGAAQRLGPPTPFGVFFACAEIGAAVIATAGLLVERTPEGARPALPLAFWRETRPLLIGGILWLAAGLTFAVVTGRNEAREVKTNRLRTAAARAATFDRQDVRDLARWPAAGAADRAAIEARLDRGLVELVRSTPFLTSARVLVLHDGWIDVVASAPKPPPRAERSWSAKPADLRHWADAAPYNEYSPIPEAGAPYYCRAPLLDAAHHTVAWLEFVREEFYSSMDRKWRTAPLLVTALGLIIATFVALQRWTSRERLAAQNAAALATEANRMKTAFLAKVSHELRTPLQSILGYCELLQADGDPSRRAARLAALRQHSELMLRLVNDLLDLSTIEAGAFRFADRPVGLGELVTQTVESLRPRAESKGLVLTCRIEPRVPAWLETDPERWRQIVLNLVGNAIKFTAHGGVRVELDVLEQDAASALVELAVTDTGPGVPPEDQARLFQTFSRLELTAQHEGVGLGLALVAALCRGAGGDVSVSSDGRSGSCFRVRLRLRTTARLEDARPLLPAPALAGRRILVADDNALVRELFADHLSACGAVCDTVADGAAALSALESGGYDALVVDLAMPGIDGLEVTRQLRARATQRLRIVGVSAHAGEAERVRARQAGMDAFLAKPVPLAALAAALGGEVVPSDDGAGRDLGGRMAQLFRAEAPPQLAAVEAARARGDWSAVRARVHWLRNSAVVLGDSDLAATLGMLEQTAEAHDAAAFDGGWGAARAELAAWLPPVGGR